MNWNLAVETNRDALERIVALLLALADLAQRAAGAPGPARCLALWSLRQADAIAREFVTGSAGNAAHSQWSPAVTPVRYGLDPAGAMNLALSLRMLALAVRNIAAQARRQFGQAPGANSHDWRPYLGPDLAVQGLWAAFSLVERRDTS